MKNVKTGMLTKKTGTKTHNISLLKNRRILFNISIFREVCNFGLYVMEMTSRMISSNILANKTLAKYEMNRMNIRYKEIESNGCLGLGFACNLNFRLIKPVKDNIFWLEDFLDLLTVEIIESRVRKPPLDTVLQVYVTTYQI